MLSKDLMHSYQWEGVDFIIDNVNSGLFLDMGLGKTVTSLTAFELLKFEYMEVDKVLVIAPKRVAENVWTSEISKWEHLNHLTVSRIIGTAKQRKLALQEEADVYTIGRDNVAWLCGQFGGLRLPFDMIIIDESSSFKNNKSVRFKALKKARASVKRMVLLTGTPAPNSLLDLWAQIYLLDKGERLGKFITHYRKEYFVAGRSNGHIVYNYDLQKQGEERIYNKINDIVMSMKAKDYLDIPERINNYIDIIFDAGLQRRYKDFEREKVLDTVELEKDQINAEIEVCKKYLKTAKSDNYKTKYKSEIKKLRRRLDKVENEGLISAANAAGLSNKLLQFANGHVYDEDKNIIPIHKLKLDAVEEIIENANGKPVLIAWTYRSDMYRLMKRLKKYKPIELKTEKNIEDWNDGKVQVMLMHPASGGHGLNLQAGGNIITWFGQTWSLELYQQFNARLDRQGQKNAVVINHLVSVKTIDQDVIKALDRKSDGQDKLMAAVKHRIKKYMNE